MKSNNRNNQNKKNKLREQLKERARESQDPSSFSISNNKNRLLEIKRTLKSDSNDSFALHAIRQELVRIRSQAHADGAEAVRLLKEFFPTRDIPKWITTMRPLKHETSNFPGPKIKENFWLIYFHELLGPDSCLSYNQTYDFGSVKNFV